MTQEVYEVQYGMCIGSFLRNIYRYLAIERGSESLNEGLGRGQGRSRPEADGKLMFAIQIP